MKVHVLAFGIIGEIMHTSSTEMEFPENLSVQDFKLELLKKYPQIKSVSSFAIAINETYATEDTIIRDKDTVAIIPPVSGG